MKLFAVGLSHHQAPIEVREKLSFSIDQGVTFLEELKLQAALEGGMLVSTCNRVEIYASADDEKSAQVIRNALLGRTRQAQVPTDMFYTHAQEDAVRHLFRVVSSLDSLVIGEPQILGQVKEAYFVAKAKHLLDPWMERWVQRSFFVAKKIRQETEIGQRAISVSYVAVTLAKKIFEDFSKRRVLILGAGEMAELCAQHLRALRPLSMTFATRTYENASELAQTYGGTAAPLDQLEALLEAADVVIVSTSADQYLIGPEQIHRVMEHRKHDPMFLIDISVPRNIDPKVNQIEDVYVYNIDDLQGIAQMNREARKSEAEKALSMIDVEAKKTFETLRVLDFGHVIQRFKDNAQILQAKELERIQRQLKHLNSEDFEVISKAMTSFADKMLHAPIRFLKEASHESLPDRQALFEEVFELANPDTGEQRK